MNYLHYNLYASQNDIVQITLDKQQAYVRLMNSINYQNYRVGRQYRYYGGLAKVSPMNLQVPYQGHWHLVIDLGGYAGTIRASVRIIKGK